MVEAIQCLTISGDAIVLIMTAEFDSEIALLLPYRQVPIHFAPLGHTLNCLRETLLCCLPLHNPPSLVPGFSPKVGKA
jgi:hypothetical protein